MGQGVILVVSTDKGVGVSTGNDYTDGQGVHTGKLVHGSDKGYALPMSALVREWGVLAIR